MARWRTKSTPAEDVSPVPAELTDWDSPAWADPAAFRRWVVTHLPDPPTEHRLEYLCIPQGHGDRYDFAVSAWAAANGFGQERNPKFPDWDRLEAAGVRKMLSLERARRRQATARNQGANI